MTLPTGFRLVRSAGGVPALACLIAFSVAAAELPEQKPRVVILTIGEMSNPLIAGQCLLSERYDFVPVSSPGSLPDGKDGIQLLLMTDAEVMHLTTEQQSLVSDKLAHGATVVLSGSGTAFRARFGIDETVRPRDGSRITAYCYRVTANGIPADYYLSESSQEPRITRETVPVTPGERARLRPAMPQAIDAVSAQGRSSLERIAAWATSASASSSSESVWGFFKDTTIIVTDQDEFSCSWQFRFAKLIDIQPNRDYYLVEIQPTTTIHGYSGDNLNPGTVGPYIHDRSTSVHYSNDWNDFAQTDLMEYAPQGTISSGSTHWSVGGSLGTDAAGVSAEYGKDITFEDITITDTGDLLQNESGWREAFMGPEYEWWPSVTEPCRNGRTTFATTFGGLTRIDAFDPDWWHAECGYDSVRLWLNLSNRIRKDTNFTWYLAILTFDRWQWEPSIDIEIRALSNRGPKIDAYNPSNNQQNVEVGSFLYFDVTHSDPDGTGQDGNNTVPNKCRWLLDDVEQHQGDSWVYTPLPAHKGSHLVKAVVADPCGLTDDQTWTVHVTDPTAVALSELEAFETEGAIHVRWRAPDTAAFTVGRTEARTGQDSPVIMLDSGLVEHVGDHWKCIDRDVIAGRSYTYRVFMQTENGDPVAYGPIALVFGSGQRGRFALMAPAPNPSRGAVAMRFETGRPTTIALDVLDVMGRRMRRVYSGMAVPGPHAVHWDGLDETGQRVASGMYFVRLRWEGGEATTRLMVVR